MHDLEHRNRVYFGLGTVGRDMFYSFEANTLLYFLSDVLSLPVWVFAAASMILSVMRIFDAFNDPITGLVIDNIRSPWGKFKPAILVGGVLSAVFSVLLFAGIGSGWGFVILFGFAYLLWDVSYGINDIGYWTLLPVLSSDQKQREKTGAFARICANVGMYIVMVAWQPVTSSLGDTPKVWFWCAVVIAAVYLLGLLFPLLGCPFLSQMCASFSFSSQSGPQSPPFPSAPPSIFALLFSPLPPRALLLFSHSILSNSL